ncbi:MAG TPA: ATP-binding cassette domain-containing protein [Firmicutes bacterium]|nr:ATP-binding cassette domain-containing protein [Bacillota bacterium]
MTETVLATHDLSRSYGRSLALDGVSLTVRKGDIYGLVGRNGAGKTTLMRLVTGQSIPTEGALELFGQTGRELLQARQRTGAMIEVPSFAPFLTAKENLEYYRLQRGIPGKQAVDEVLELVGLRDTGKKKFKSFSLGMKQRLGLALALMNHPDFLILDEPINGLDPEGVAEFRALLLRLNQERETTILISSHILTELSSVATCYGFLERGGLLEEISAQTLHERCRTCLRLTVNDAAKAAMLLQTELGTENFEVLPGNVIELYDHLDRPQEVSGALASGGVALLGMEQKSADLEAYFLKLIGGGKQ